MPNAALMSLLEASDTEGGQQLVDPDFHTSPQFVSESARDAVALFRSRFLNSPRHNNMKSLGSMYGLGATEKAHFRIGGHRDEEGQLLPSSLFMVKPYYEHLKGWSQGDLPLSGWAEMAWHGVLHAAGLGDSAMKIHTFQYPEKTGMPLYAVELDDGHHPACALTVDEPWRWESGHGKVNIPISVKTKAFKVAMLDFLLNNQDRSGRNLMVGFDPTSIPEALPTASGILAIDNGRSLQYVRPNRYHDRDSNLDHLFDYVSSPGYEPFEFRQSLGAIVPHVAKWWKEKHPAIQRELDRHLAGIKSPSLATHIRKSFNDRADALDRFSVDVESKGAQAYAKGMSNDINNGGYKAQWSRVAVPMRPVEE